jgi:hypothetical protein
MKRILLVVLAVAALVATAVPAFAQEGTKLGFGYFRPQAPVGGRAWINDKMAVDVGIGFENKDQSGGGKVEKKTTLWFDAGMPYVLVGDETTKFFVRPGITYCNSPVWDSGAGTTGDWASSTTIWVSGTLGVEHWFGKKFSLSAGHGLVFQSFDPGTEGSDTSSEIMSEALSIANVGFHFYFN